MNKAVQVTYFLFRVVTGLLFFQVGAMKMFGWFGGMPGGGTPPLMSQIGIGGVLEVVGGVAIMLGLLTRRWRLSFLARWRSHTGSFTHPMPHGLFKTKANLRSCSVSSSCTWRHVVLASGASMS